MADFFQDEAEVSDMSGSEEEEGSGSDEDAEFKKKKKKKEAKKKKARVMIEDDDDDEDEEEEDPDAIEEEMKGFIINNDEVDEEEEEEGEESGEEEGEGKRKRDDDDDDMDDRLEDEDFDLIEENLGIKVNRKQQRKRIRVMSDEGSDNEDSAMGIDGKQAIKETLFDDDDDVGEDIAATPARELGEEERNEFGDLDEEEESDIDDFIVDDEGRPISKGKKKKHIIHSDKALQEAQDIFGVDFSYEDFEEYGNEEDEFDEEYEDDDDIGEDGEQRARAKKQKKRATKKSIFDVFEPSELERGHFTELDNEIRTTDMPERFQLRQIPVVPTEEGELEEEAEWIYKQAFASPGVSNQAYVDQDQVSNYNFSNNRRGPNMVNKIKEAVNFMRNQRLEVPFIAFYRKEYVEPELNIKDLWKVWQFDEKWTQLMTRRKNLVRLFEKMQNYLAELWVEQEATASEKNIRPLTEQDMDRVRSVQTMDELRDVYQHFLLYYGHEIPTMRLAEKKRRAQERAERSQDGEEVPVEEEPEGTVAKQATRRSGYSICLNARLDEIARQFGLKPSEVGENLRDNYQRHDVQQCPVEPLELAKDYVCPQFSSEEEVLSGSRHMVAMQISHDPLVRQAVRQTYYERAKLKVRATKKGIKMIDEGHVVYPMKYLRNKPVKDLKDEQYLKLVQAESDGLVTSSISIDDDDSTTYFEEVRQLYYRDEFSHLVQQWNIQRSEALKRALEKILYPQMEKELRSKLILEAKEGIIKACSRRLYNWLKVAPYQAEQQLDDDYDDDDSSNGVRVLGIAYSTEQDMSAFGAMIDGDGVVSDFVRLAYFTYRRNSFRQMERDWKEKDVQKLKEFILTKKPHVVAVTAESRDGMMIVEDVKAILSDLEQEEQIPPINVELVDNEVAMIFENSSKSQSEFREYPPTLRHAVSIARRIQNPLVEFAQLCNPDEDIMCLKYHPMQDQVPKEELVNALYLEFVNRVNEVGVDINQCIAFPHTASLLQFVCGLGPRKASYLLKILKQNNSRLENRTQLVQLCHMGPKVFINCAGFIKLDTNSLGDSTDTYVDVLDGSRVHPEAYEWARKMAVDALEYDDTAEDANPAGALEEILESPERLKDLDLDAFAEELERQGYGDKHITLYDIRAELNQRYKDLRTPYRAPTNEERFNMLTKETPETFYVGKLVMCRVNGIAYKRPQGDQLDQANPNRNEETGLWQCPFCLNADFPELSDVWSHFDGGNCPGSAVGVKTRLDNGVSGFIHCKNISDKNVRNPEERVKRGMMIHARITKIDIDRFQVELTSKSSDLLDKDGNWKPQKDLYYDYDYEKTLVEKEEEKIKQQARQTYIKRVIAHPNFKNIGYKECEKVMANMDLGDVIIRPSSKGSDHLTVTWKVSEGVLQHIDVIEEGKENSFSLGKSLLIGEEEFEDLDEIIARHIQPMAGCVRDLVGHRYYKEVDDKRDVIEKMLSENKKKMPTTIPYSFSVSHKYPGKFMLSYMPRNKARHEYLTVTPDGLKYRQQVFSSLNSMIRWFKDHFRDPIPGTPASTRTPAAASAYATPNIGLQGMTPGRTPNRPMYGSLPQATPQAATPSFSSRGFPGTYGAGLHSGFQGPMATPMMTPMMTPSSFMPPGSHMTTPVGGAGPTSHATPSYQPTPRAGGASSSVWPGATPRTPAARTPAMTSRAPANSNMAPRTPSRTPHGGVASSPSSGKQSSSIMGMSSVGAGTDWAREAELWAKQRQAELMELGGSGGSTPRGGGSSTPGGATPRGATPRGTPRSSSSKSPRVSSGASPAPASASTSYGGGASGSHYSSSGGGAGGESPQGDATPLIDER